MRILLAILLAAASFCFGLGVSLPLLTVTRLVFFTENPSLAQIVAGLWTGGDRLLAAAIGLFSIAFPAVKLIYLHVVALGGAPAHLHGALRALANWSMLDVMLVAIVIFAAKTSGLATAVTQSGLWFYATSAIAIVIASYLAGRVTAGGGKEM